MPGFGIGVVAVTFLVTFKGQLDLILSILRNNYMDLNVISKKVHNHWILHLYVRQCLF